MKPPTFAPIFVGMYPLLCEAARAHGYALAVHGTVARDMDLVAVPWTASACSAEELYRALLRTLHVDQGDAADGAGRKLDDPVAKPHGRIAWMIHLGCGATLDLSVMPRAQEEAP